MVDARCLATWCARFFDTHVTYVYIYIYKVQGDDSTTTEWLIHIQFVNSDSSTLFIILLSSFLMDFPFFVYLPWGWCPQSFQSHGRAWAIEAQHRISKFIRFQEDWRFPWGNSFATEKLQEMRWVAFNIDAQQCKQQHSLHVWDLEHWMGCCWAASWLVALAGCLRRGLKTAFVNCFAWAYLEPNELSCLEAWQE